MAPSPQGPDLQQDSEAAQKQRSLLPASPIQEAQHLQPGTAPGQRASLNPHQVSPATYRTLQNTIGNQAIVRHFVGSQARSAPRSPIQPMREGGSATSIQGLTSRGALENLAAEQQSTNQPGELVQRWLSGGNSESNEEGQGFFSRIGGVFAEAGGAIAQGAEWLGNKITEGAQWLGDKAVAGAEWARDAAKTAIYNDDFDDLNATQYRIRADGVIEVVQRQVNAEGQPEYWVTGIVESFEGSRPVVTPKEPESLGDWAPRVTHINGMMVKPEEGIGSAQKLQEALSTHLEQDGEVGLTPDVLYTYSSTRGFGRDLIECLAGKLYIDDAATDQQETIMLDAVRNKRRTTVSAHSRGTIKTDNAVRNVHSELTQEFMDAAQHDEKVQQAAEEAARLYELHGEQMIGIDRDMYVEIIRREKARQIAGQIASEKMDEYIQLIYAGNAVEFPSSKLKGQLVVGHLDAISMLVGTSTDFGTPDNMTMHKVKGGHGFDENYADTVGKLVADDIEEERAGRL